MFRSNYVRADKSPMVYIVSHTWPNRWITPGIKDSIIVYSNCDEVELFNDVDNISLGKRAREGIGTHFQWDKVDVRYNVLVAVGYRNGKAVARDTVVLQSLPRSPHFEKLFAGPPSILVPAKGYHYVYRVNCGGGDYIDELGNTWLADQALSARGDARFGSTSWTNEFPGMPPFFASQRRTFSPIRNTRDWKLFQEFRYGRNKLEYHFALPDGEYQVELFFIEPWLGIGGQTDAAGMRQFDVAFNDHTVLNGLDIWREAGTNAALKKTIRTRVSGGQLKVSFPNVQSGQAIISAIAICAQDGQGPPAVHNALRDVKNIQHWGDIGKKVYKKDNILFHQLPSILFGADWISPDGPNDRLPDSLKLQQPAQLFVALKGQNDSNLLRGYEDMKLYVVTDENEGTKYAVYRRILRANEMIDLSGLTQAIVFIQPISTMQPAYDLKSSTAYRTDVATVSSNITKMLVSGRQCAVISNDAEASMEWPVQTGVADIYSITVKYFYPGTRTIVGRLLLTGANDDLLLDLPVTLHPTTKDKWNQFTVNTGNMINAGRYKVQLTVRGGSGLAVSGIEVQ
jgi:hypothetical protein